MAFLSWITLLVAAVALGVAGCRQERRDPSTHRPNILLITIDTIRADHCSTYGYDRNTTPALSRVAEQGVLFTNAYAPMATTGPSHATMLTSLYPRTHGVVKNGFVLDRRVETLPEVLKTGGYQTAAIVSSYPVAARFGFDQGFDLYDDDFEADGRELKPRLWEGIEVDTFFDRDARVTTELASTWVREGRRPGGPFFLWVHYFDPHAPYEPPEEYRDLYTDETTRDQEARSLERTIALYDAEVRETDDAIGRFLRVIDAEGLTESTVLVIAGDHGEGLMQHGYMQHGIHLYEEQVRVPLVIRWPRRIPAGNVIPEPVELLDLKTTLLDLVGLVGDAAQHQGRNLAGIVAGQEVGDPDRPIFLERRLYGARTVGRFEVSGSKLGVRAGDWKYIEANEEGTRELFDLEGDPFEASNLVADFPIEAVLLSNEISSWLERTPRTYFSPDTVVSEEDAEKLRALGYVE